VNPQSHQNLAKFYRVRHANRRVWPILGLGLLVSVFPACAINENYDLHSGWNQAKAYLYKDAWSSFVQAKGKPSVNERERILGEACSLLNVQPRTKTGILKVRQMLEAITLENPHDTSGILARYLTGRIFEFHQQPPDPTRAIAIYRKLIEEHSSDPIAEFAMVPLVHLELYRPLTQNIRLEKFRDLEELGKVLQTPAGLRDYHLAMGGSALDLLHQPGLALRHLLAADRVGISRPETESLIWQQIGELARYEGNTQAAVTFYGKFLEKYPRNYSSYSIQKKLEAIHP
jgi:tetratricopeptide (TPR) repeat protein